LTEVILARKAKVLMTWLNGTNPVINVSLDDSGRLRFDNAAEQVGMAKAAAHYAIAWSRFDNTTGTHTPAGSEQTVTTRAAQAPRELLSAPFVAVTIKAYHPDQPEWQQPLVAFFRRAPDGSWSLAGLERNANEVMPKVDG
jgi:hypothetical protein